ncbi:MAG TPA: response regulator transcription factor [Chitinophagaceae bacterium]|nr:response regulator transcription factor [Chitinophagaceae bacterium]
MIKVAIVEDTRDIRESLRQILEHSEEFVCVGTYPDGEQAIKEIPDVKPDIVMMDIHLPGMDGVECVSRLKAQCPETLFIMCTIFQDDQTIFKALRAGASGYLLKKSSVPQILDSLMELYQGGSPMSMEIARRVVESFKAEPQAGRGLDLLSKRENEILQLLATGLMYKEIAAHLHISTETVRRHVHHIYEKLHVQTRTEAVNVLYGKANHHSNF